MKFLPIFFILLLSGCFGGSNCAHRSFWKDFKFGDRVKIHGGFYKGQKGYIIAKATTISNGCTTNAFKVRLDYNANLNKERLKITVSQFSLLHIEE